jgi:hypothetical protein
MRTERQTDGRMDRETKVMKLIVTYSYFANAPKNQMEGFGKYFLFFIQPRNYSNLRISVTYELE